MKIIKDILSSPQNLFLFLATIFGLSIIFFTPPMSVPDEPAHFYKTYDISKGVFLPDLNTIIPSQIQEIALKCRKNAVEKNHKNCVTKNAFINFSNTTTTNSPAGLYSPTSYIIQGMTLYIAHFFSDNFFTYYFSGKIIMFIFWIICSYITILYMPFGKWFTLLYILLPMNVFEAISYSSDSILNITVFLSVALILHLRFGVNEQTFKREKEKYLSLKFKTFLFIIINTLFLIFCLAKGVYAPFILLIFLIPAKIFKNKKKYLLFCFGSIALNLFLILFWAYLIKDYQALRIKDISPHQQLLFILNNKILYLKILIKTIYEPRAFYLMSFVGNLGWLNINLSFYTYFSYIFVLFISSFLSPVKTNISTRLVYFIISCSSIFGVFLLLYMTWTIPRNLLILGVQGRYLLPSMFIFFIGCFGLIKFPTKSIRPALIGCSVSAYLCTVYYDVAKSCWEGFRWTLF